MHPYFLAILVASYVTPFFLLLLTPNRRWLAICSGLLAAIPAASMIYILLRSDQYEDSFGAGIVFFGSLIPIAGVVGGVLTRLVTLSLAAQVRPVARWAGSLLALAALPAFFVAPQVADYWRDRPTPATCQDSPLKVTLRDQQLSLPMAPTTRIAVVEPQRDQTLFSFYKNDDVRRLCDIKARDQALPITSVSFGQLWGPPSEWEERNCAASAGPARPAVCDIFDSRNRYGLRQLVIYDPRFPARQRLFADYPLPEDGAQVCKKDGRKETACRAKLVWAGGLGLAYEMRAEDGVLDDMRREALEDISTLPTDMKLPPLPDRMMEPTLANDADT